jgi:hypothetical protein
MTFDRKELSNEQLISLYKKILPFAKSENSLSLSMAASGKDLSFIIIEAALITMASIKTTLKKINVSYFFL